MVTSFIVVILGYKIVVISFNVPSVWIEIKFVMDIALYVVFIIACILIYIKLKATLRSNLNYYYENSRKMLFLIALLNVAYFSMLILYRSLYFFKFAEEVLEPKDESSKLVKAMFLVIVI